MSRPRRLQLPVRGVSPLTKWTGAAAIFFAISRVHQHFGVLAQLRALALLSAASLALLVATSRDWRPGDLTKHWLSRGICAIAAIAVLGVPFAIWPGNSFSFVTGPLPKTLLLGVVTWAIARTPPGREFMAKVFAASGLGAVLLTRLLGRQDSSGRLSGAYTYDPNDIALIAVVALPLLIWWILESRGFLRALLLASLPLMLHTIFKTDSRSGALGLAAVVVGLFLTLRRRGMPRKVAWMPKAIIAAGVVTVIMLPADYRARLSSISSEDDYNRHSKTGRIEIWKRGMRYALTHPIVGVGIDNFNTAEGHLSGLSRPGKGFKWSTAHNSFVLAFAELGLPAGFLFTFLILRTVRTLSFGRIRGPPEYTLLAAFVGVSWIGFSVSGFFLSFTYYDITYVLFGLSGGIMLSAETQLPPSPGVRRPQARRQWARAPGAPHGNPGRG